MDPVTISVVTAVVAALSNSPWKVILEKVVGSRGVKPDIVIEDADGESYVVEVKLGQGTAHFSDIAQAESAASGLTEEKRSAGVTPILLTNREVPDKIREVANDVGVTIVEASGTGEQVAEALVKYLGDRNPR